MSNSAINLIHQKMQAIGITDSSIKKLLNAHSINYLQSKIDILNYLLCDCQHTIQNPAGYLYKSIQENYPPPPGYTPPKQKEIEKRLKEVHQAKQQQRVRSERATEAIFYVQKLMEKKERELTVQLAQSMDEATEDQLRRFIDKHSGEHTCSCDSYNLRSSSIEKKKEDFVAGYIFEALRHDFFKAHRPELFSNITVRQIARKSGKFSEEQIAYLQKAIYGS